MTGPNTVRHLVQLRALIARGVCDGPSQARAMNLSKGYLRHLRHLLKRANAKAAEKLAGLEEFEAAELSEIDLDTEDASAPPGWCIPDWYGRP